MQILVITLILLTSVSTTDFIPFVYGVPNFISTGKEFIILGLISPITLPLVKRSEPTFQTKITAVTYSKALRAAPGNIALCVNLMANQAHGK